MQPKNGKDTNRSGTGCSRGALFFISIAGILIPLLLGEFFFWLRDEFSFEAPLFNIGVGRPVVLAIIALIMSVPLGVIYWRVKDPLYKGGYRVWFIGSILMLTFTPARVFQITKSQVAQAVQIGILLILAAAFWIRARRHNPSGINFGRGTSLVLILSGAIAYPWLAWGAMGSLLDTILGLLVGVLIGVVSALVLYTFFFSPWRQAGIDLISHFGMASVVCIVFLILITIGTSYTGFQWYLLFVLPFLGWLIPALASMEGGWATMALLIGLSAAFPIMLVDPDELSLIISSGPGEILQWTIRAGLFSFAIIALAGLGVRIYRKRLVEWRPSRILIAGVAIIWLIGGGIFFLIGRPGFFGERLFVILKNQADLSAAPGMTDYNQRRTFVYQTLVRQANETQSRLRAALNRMKADYTPYYLENAIEVRGGPAMRLWLLQQPEVDRVLDNPILRPLPAPIPQARGNQPAPQSTMWNQSMIHADQVWKELGVTGKGIVVGQSDSGAQGDHPEIVAGYRGAAFGGDYNWYDPWFNSSTPVDIGGHGTHTLGTILGAHTGIAPGATWIGCVNLARNLGNPALYLDCMQFMLAPFPQGGDPFKDGDPTRSANVLNNSWGCPEIEGCDAKALLPAVNALRAAGIFVVASAGNDGDAGCDTVADPLALYSTAYSVGAIDSKGQLASFSSLGPVTADGSGRTKPDIVAPGVQVLSAFPGNTYELADGTSMAGPHVVGVVALMWSANPKLIGDIDQTANILDQTAQTYTGIMPGCAHPDLKPNDGVGWGLVDAYAAVKAAMDVR